MPASLGRHNDNTSANGLVGRAGIVVYSKAAAGILEISVRSQGNLTPGGHVRSRKEQ